MLKKGFLIFLGIVTLFPSLFAGCERLKGKKPEGRELVRINDVSISLEEFHQLMDRLSLEGKMKLLNEKGMRDFLDSYVIPREALLQEARKRGFDTNKEIHAKVEDFRRALIIDALLEEVLKGKAEVTEEEIQKYYKENPALFTEPQEIKIRHIVVNSEPMLQEVLAKLSKGEAFDKLASGYNIDNTREVGGDLGYIRRGQLAASFAQFEEAAFSLRKPGEMTQVVRSPYGFHIIRLEDVRGTALRPLDKVKENIRLFLQPQKKQEATLAYMKEVKSRAKVTINETLWAEELKKEEKSENKK
jgi:peptidyl-prolyl cis-trans isomerase C